MRCWLLLQVSVLTIDTKPSSASGECATGLPKFVRSQNPAFDNALEGADGDWLAAVHGNDGLPPIGMAPFLVAAALAHAREAMRPNMGVRTKVLHNSLFSRSRRART